MPADPARADALASIKSLLGAGGFVDDPAQMLPYVTSMRYRHRHPSRLVARPSTTREVAEIVRICARSGVPVVPQGGNTGLVDGGIPSPDGREIIISLSRMNRIRALDPVGSIVTVEAGVVLQTLREAAAEAGFLFPLNMASQGTMQIGGAISTNAGGTAVLRYGTMRQLVLGLEVVLPDGEVMSSLKRLVKDNTGYHLSQNFIGAEGTLGIVTAATLRLFPALRQTLTVFAAIPDAASALALLREIRGAHGETLTTFELMSSAALGLVARHDLDVRLPVRDDAPWYLLIELGSSSLTAPLREPFEALAEQALDQGMMLDAALAESTAQVRQFWHWRESITEALRKTGHGIHFDIALPIAELADFLTMMAARLRALAPDLVPMPYGHVGDGNLHYNMYAPADMAPEDFAALKPQVQALVYGEVERRQGSISAEHGIGVERKPELASSKSALEIKIMRRIKAALDPQGIMNPGKIFD